MPPLQTGEVNIIYKFLLELYLDKVFEEYGGQVEKKVIQDRFNSFCSKEQIRLRDNILHALVRNDFAHPLLNPHNQIVVIKTWTFMQIHKQRIKQRDDALIKLNDLKNQENSSKINQEKVKKETFILKFLEELYLTGNMASRGGFYDLDKQSVDEKFRAYCLANKVAVTKLVSMLRSHGYLQYVTTQQISVKKDTFLENYEQFKLAKKLLGGSSKCSKIKNEDPSTSEVQIDENFTKNDLECFRVFDCEDLLFNDSKMGCFICQESFPSKSSFNKHIQQHKMLDIEFEESSLNVNDVFKVSYYISKVSKNFIFTLRTDIDDINLKRVILIGDSFQYFFEEGVSMQKGEEIKILIEKSKLRPEDVYPLMISYKYKNCENSKIYFQEHLVMVKQFYYNKFTEDNEFFWTPLIPEVDLPREKLPTPVFPNENKLLKIYRNNRYFDELKEALAKFSPEMNKYFKINKCLTRENFIEVSTILLKLEEFFIDEEYEKLSKKDSVVQIELEPIDPNFNGKPEEAIRYSITLTHLPKNSALDVLLQAHDIIVFKDTRNSDEFICYVKEIDGNKIIFNHNQAGKSKSYKSLNMKSRYKVEFLPNKIQLEFQYRAMQLVSECLKTYLFPDEKDYTFNTKPCRIIPVEKLFQKNLSSEQIEAVSNIVGKHWNNKSPYLLFGPPGTGKTMTIVESVLQILKNTKTNKVLITVNSNAACDEIGKRLKKFIHLFNDSKLILRIYSAAHAFNISNWDDDFLKISNLCHGYHYYPTIRNVKEFRVIIATSVVSAKYIQSGMGKGSFSHIFIDENASSTLPEALLGLAGVWNTSTKVILSGDPMQLGAVLRNDCAGRMGLERSLMERLMDNWLYAVNDRGQYNQQIQTRLTANYRSHPEILNLFNKLFYENTLSSAANNNSKINCARGWHRLKRHNIPIIFHNTYKPSQRDVYETSLYNLTEIDRVFDYIRELMFFGLNGSPVQQEDIGIVAPYRKQYSIIRHELDRRGWKAILVGAPEIFQGQEKPIIIATVVRSETDTVGFLRNFRRLNVIISRAESLLIIICNDNTLEKDPHWKKLIDICKGKGVFANPPKRDFIYKNSYSKKYSLQDLKIKFRGEII